MKITLKLENVAETVVHKNVKTIERKPEFVWLLFDNDRLETIAYPWRVVNSVHTEQES